MLAGRCVVCCLGFGVWGLLCVDGSLLFVGCPLCAICGVVLFAV